MSDQLHSTLDEVGAIVRKLRSKKGQLAVGIWETRTTGRLGFVMQGIKSKRKAGRHIEDGYQYVGASPANMWRLATIDRRYKTLSYGIKTFPDRWESLRQQVTEPLHYVSIGPGTGEKDNAILKHLQKLIAERGGPPIVYMPVDISADLLKMSFDESMREIDESLVELLPLELDITAGDAVKTLNSLRPAFPGESGALISLLGNTLANFRDDHNMLTHIGGLLCDPDDMLLLEVATTRDTTEELAEVAEEEYEGSMTFREFVMAALSQYTDCIPSSGEVIYEAVVKPGRLEITTMFICEEDRVINLTDGDKFTLKAREKIKLYKSRKYTEEGLQALLEGFDEIEEDNTSYGDPNGFGVVTKLLTRKEASGRPHRWSTSHPVGRVGR